MFRRGNPCRCGGEGGLILAAILAAASRAASAATRPPHCGTGGHCSRTSATPAHAGPMRWSSWGERAGSRIDRPPASDRSAASRGAALRSDARLRQRPDGALRHAVARGARRRAAAPRAQLLQRCAGHRPLARRPRRRARRPYRARRATLGARLGAADRRAADRHPGTDRQRQHARGSRRAVSVSRPEPIRVLHAEGRATAGLRDVAVEAPVAIEVDGPGLCGDDDDAARSRRLRARLHADRTPRRHRRRRRGYRRLRGRGGMDRPRARAAAHCRPRIHDRVRHRSSDTGCACAERQPGTACRPVRQRPPCPVVEPAAIFAALAAIRAHQRLNAATGAVHCPAACTADGAIAAIFEDVGRHMRSTS